MLEVLQSAAIWFLMGMSSILGVSSTPVVSDGVWKIDKEWHSSGDSQFFQASSTKLAEVCQNNPTSYIKFPVIIHGAHELLQNGSIFYKFGDPSFKTTRSFYGAPVVPCEILGEGEVVWRAYSYSEYFARIQHFPKLASSRPLTNFINETLNSVAAGALLLMSLFSFLISIGKISKRLVFSLCISYAALSGYFLFGSASFFGIDISMLWSHKLADLCVWIGLIFIVYTLKILETVPKAIFYAFLTFVVPAMAIVAIGNTGDQVQLGASLPFGMTLFALSFALVNQLKLLVQSKDRLYALRSLGLAFWTISVVNDILVVTGLYDGYATLSIGTVGGLFFFGLALHERILSAYNERDYLRENLELEVERKTEQLKTKTQELEDAMQNLKSTQSELVQSEKLASLGTLTAGIAHEINNSLNYVNGALIPLEKLAKKTSSGEDVKKVEKLVGVMKDGLKLTFEIIKSLKSYTGLNRSEQNEVNFSEVVNSVVTILKTKLRDRYELKIDIDPNIVVYGSVAGLNQIFMNLVTNSLDAMPEGGTLKVEAKSREKDVLVTVTDSGVGIPKNIVDRIFDPFYTTKDVGKGTGLGLYIVKKEVERQNGEVTVESEPGRGTVFTLHLPKENGFEEMCLKEAV